MDEIYSFMLQLQQKKENLICGKFPRDEILLSNVSGQILMLTEVISDLKTFICRCRKEGDKFEEK